MISDEMVERYAQWFGVPARLVRDALTSRDRSELVALGLTPEDPESQIRRLIT